MDRTIKQEAGFTFVELVITLAIVGILVALSGGYYSHMNEVNAINADIHKISAFVHAQKLKAFTRKQAVILTVAGNQITSSTGEVLTLKNPLQTTGSPFTVSTRGNITSGNIRMHNSVDVSGVQYSCVKLDNIRTRVGARNGANCNPI